MGGAYGRTGFVLWRSVAEAKQLQGPSGQSIALYYRVTVEQQTIGVSSSLYDGPTTQCFRAFPM